jgi:hypothetical protein
MSSRHIRPILIFLIFPLLVIFGCGNSDSAKTEKAREAISPLIGTWQKIAEGQKQVSDVVTMTISENTLTMDAPGCLITGNYSVADGVLTFTITAADGTRCASGQMVGKSDSVNYAVTGKQLTLIPLLAGEERKLVYQRVDTSHR